MREQHLTPVTGGGDAGAPMHIHADVSVVSDRGLSRMDTHSHPQRQSLRPRVIGQGALSSNRRLNRLPCARENQERGVAFHVDYPPAVCIGCPSQNRPMRLERIPVPGAECFQKMRRTLDVAEQEGDSSARELGHVTIFGPRRLAVEPSLVDPGIGAHYANAIRTKYAVIDAAARKPQPAAAKAPVVQAEAQAAMAAITQAVVAKALAVATRLRRLEQTPPPQRPEQRH